MMIKEAIFKRAKTTTSPPHSFYLKTMHSVIHCFARNSDVGGGGGGGGFYSYQKLLSYSNFSVPVRDAAIATALALWLIRSFSIAGPSCFFISLFFLAFLYLCIAVCGVPLVASETFPVKK